MLGGCLADAARTQSLRGAPREPQRGPSCRPKALISPHAGCIYSGPIAASAYRALGDGAHGIERVGIIGPSHFVPIAGLAVAHADAFATPPGTVVIDEPARRRRLDVRLPDLRNSGDTSAECTSVDGYGAFALYEPGA